MVVFPTLCFNCWQIGFFLCPSCQNKLHFCGVHHRKYFAFYRYNSLASRILKKTKYRLFPRVLSNFLENIPLFYWWALLDFGRPLKRCCLLPVPLSPLNRAERGFNQAQIIASFLGEKLNLPVIDCLEKKYNRQKQAMLHGLKERRSNVLGVYALRPGKRLDNERVILVDDVYTSGSTMREIETLIPGQVVGGISLFKGG